jgi:hypothetical protein
MFQKLSKEWVQASTAVQMRYSLFWDVRQRRLVVICQGFGTTHGSHLQGSSNSGLLYPLRWERWLVSKCWYITTNLGCLISQKSEDLKCSKLEILFFLIPLDPNYWVSKCYIILIIRPSSCWFSFPTKKYHNNNNNLFQVGLQITDVPCIICEDWIILTWD